MTDWIDRLLALKNHEDCGWLHVVERAIKDKLWLIRARGPSILIATRGGNRELTSIDA